MKKLIKVFILTLLFMKGCIVLLFSQLDVSKEFIRGRSLLEITNNSGQFSLLLSDSSEGGSKVQYLRWYNFWRSRVGGINDSGTSGKIFKTIKL